MKTVHVYPDNRLVFNGKTYRCALGPKGVIPAADKREGDLCTPAGNFPIREIWYRADRVTLPRVNFPVHEISPDDGWCDAPDHPKYNQHINKKTILDAGGTFPSHEAFWREDDDLYNIIVIFGHNDDPPVPGMGSCIFWHIARSNYTPSTGCITVSQADMLEILPQLTPGARFEIHPAAQD
jgi:L,D-peptidoglycan transpeptidase YkuD (ErfK/YbiS/YcfS/YnhG family)